MATREIKATLALDGEKQFSSQIKAAQRNLRAMRAEVKAEAAEFEANGNAMQANEARLKSLAAQQKQQEVIVKALEQAVEDAAKKFGENSAQVDNYRMRLASARAELAQMEMQERKLTDANKEAGKSFEELKKDVSANWKQVAGDISSALSGITAAATGVFAAVSAAAIGAGKTVVGWAVDASNQADDLLTEAEVTGIDPVTLQEWQYAARFIDTNVDTITGSIKKLRRSMANDSTADLIKGMGISLTDNAGHMRDAADVFWDIIDQVHANKIKYGDNTETDNLLQTILGSSYDQLKPLIHTGRNAWESLGIEAQERDIVMDQATLDAYGDFNDTLGNIDAMLQAIPTSIATFFLPGIKDAAEQVDQLLTVFNQFLHGDATADDVAAEAADVVEAVIEAVQQGIAAVDEIIGALKASDDPNVKAIGELLDGIKNAALGLWENRTKIKIGAEIVLGLWTATKIAGTIEGLITFGGHIATLIGSLLALKGAGVAAAEGIEAVNAASGVGGAAAGGAAAAGAGKFVAAGTSAVAVTSASLLAVGASIFQGFAEEAAANDAFESAYVSKKGTDAEKEQAAWNAWYDVKEPGMTGSWEIAKVIAGWLGLGPKDQWDGVSDEQLAAVEMIETDSRMTKAHYEAAEKDSAHITGQVDEITDMVDSVLDDLQQYISYSNWQRAMQRGEAEGTVDDANLIIDTLNAIDEKYGGSILDNTKEGQKYLGILQTMSAGALDSLPTIDAVFNLQPAEGTEEAIDATIQSWHLEAPLYLTPVGGFSASDFMGGMGGSMVSGAAAGVGGTANVQINLDGRAIGRAVAPIVDEYIGSRIAR